MNKLLVSILLLFVFTNCSNKKKEIDREYQESFHDELAVSDYKPYEKNKKYCNRILISPYPDKNDKYYPLNPKKIYETDALKFERLLINAEKTAYCCCPQKTFIMAFFNNTTEFDNYDVDTTEFKNKIRIYDTSFQFSYLVDKASWNNFLKNASTNDTFRYSSSDLLKGRKIYEFAESHNLILKSSSNVSSNWMFFDGEFTLKVKENGKELKAIDIVNKIKNAFQDFKFKAEVVKHLQSYSPDKKIYFDSEIEMIIYCNKNFYDKFNLYKSKSKFRYTRAEFFVTGERKKINQITEIK